VRGRGLLKALTDLSLAPRQTRLLYVREAPEEALYHQWGGKRLSEAWDPETNTLRVALQGPVSLTDRVFLGCGDLGVAGVTVNGEPAEFFVDKDRGLVHGPATFGREPLLLEAVGVRDGTHALPEKAVEPDPVTAQYPSEDDAAR
jgi:hypothetical protein